MCVRRWDVHETGPDIPSYVVATVKISVNAHASNKCYFHATKLWEACHIDRPPRDDQDIVPQDTLGIAWRLADIDSCRCIPKTAKAKADRSHADRNHDPPIDIRYLKACRIWTLQATDIAGIVGRCVCVRNGQAEAVQSPKGGLHVVII